MKKPRSPPDGKFIELPGEIVAVDIHGDTMDVFTLTRLFPILLPLDAPPGTGMKLTSP